MIWISIAELVISSLMLVTSIATVILAYKAYKQGKK